MSKGETIVNLMEELWQMPEYTLFLELRGLDVSIHTFHKNYVALHTILTFLTSDERADPLFAAKNRDNLSEVGKDIVCYIHNYVASAISLIDHTRNLYKKLYIPAQQFPEYQERVTKEFAQDPLAQFVKCLRQYCQHYRSPEISVRTTFPNGFNARPMRKIRLALSDLQTFDKWNAPAKKYLSSIEDAVDIHEVATVYLNKVMTFYQWFQSRQDEIHADEIKRFRAKEAELQVLKVDDRIDSYFAFHGNMQTTKHDVFVGVLPSEDFHQLEQAALAPHEQAQLAIHLLEKYFPLSDEIKQQIFRLYHEPG